MKPVEETEVVNVSGGRLEVTGEPPVGEEDTVEPPVGEEDAVEPPVGEEDALEPPGFGNLAFLFETKSSMLPEKSSLV